MSNQSNFTIKRLCVRIDTNRVQPWYMLSWDDLRLIYRPKGFTSVNILGPEQFQTFYTGHFECIFLKVDLFILTQISLKLPPKLVVDIKPVWVQIIV